MDYWFNLNAVKGAIPIAGSTFFKGLMSSFATASVFAGSNLFPEGKQLLPGPASWIGVRCPRKRAMIVTDQFAQRFAVKVEAAFRDQAGFTTSVWSECEPEAPLESVKKLAAAMKAFEPDLIVPVGGGSVIDTAKAAWVFYERPEFTDLRMVTPFLPLNLRKKAIMAAVPTTAGTASETTSAMVVTEDETRRKIPLQNPELMPDFALLNPEFTISMPPALTMGCGIDVLTHAIDGLLCTRAGDFTDAMGVKSLELVFKWLPRAHKNGRDKEARHRMLMASCMAGMCFGNSATALTHSLGHALGASFKVHHGVAVGIFLPYALQFYHPATDRISLVAKTLGLPADSKDQALASVLGALKEFYGKLDAPWSIKELGVSRPDFDAALPRLAQLALDDPSGFATPRPASLEECRRLLIYAYDGKDVDF